MNLSLVRPYLSVGPITLVRHNPPNVSGGLNGGWQGAYTSATYGPGRSLEFLATFGAHAFENIGFRWRAAIEGSYLDHVCYELGWRRLYARIQPGAVQLVQALTIYPTGRFLLAATSLSHRLECNQDRLLC